MAKLANLARMTTPTLGTGTMTLAAAAQSFLTFAQAGIADGDVVTYAIEDGANREIGRGTYAASGPALSRDSVLNSTNGGGRINLGGSAEVFVTLAASDVREALTANRTYYVRTDGSDVNTGLANTAAGAFLTIQKAVDTISASLDLNGFTVTVQVADGTYTGAVALKNVVGFRTSGDLVIQGNAGSPTNVVVSPTGGNGFTAVGLSALWILKDLKITTSGGGTNGIFVIRSYVQFSGIDFGAVGQSHLNSQSQATIEAVGNYAISGDGPLGHALAVQAGFILLINRTVNISNTPNFSAGFARCPAVGGCAVIRASNMTFVGTAATGPRYVVSNNGVIDTNAGGANYFPGNAAGSMSSGGQYV